MASNEDKLRIIDSVMNNLSIIVEKKREHNLGNNEIRDLFAVLVQSSVDIIDNKTPALPAPQETVIEGTATAVISTVEKKEKEELPPGHPDYYASQYRKIGSILRAVGVKGDDIEYKKILFSFYNQSWQNIVGDVPKQEEFCRIYAKEIIEVNEEYNNSKKRGQDLKDFATTKLAAIKNKHKKDDQPWPDDVDVAAAAAQPAVTVKKAEAKKAVENDSASE